MDGGDSTSIRMGGRDSLSMRMDGVDLPFTGFFPLFAECVKHLSDEHYHLGRRTLLERDENVMTFGQSSDQHGVFITWTSLYIHNMHACIAQVC